MGLLLAPSLAAEAAPTARGNVYIVTSTGGGGGGGAGCSAEFCLLRDAVQAAEASPGADTIRFAPFLTGSTISLSSALELRSALRIDGVGRDVTLSGGDANRVAVVARGAQVELVGLTLADGLALGGGAIRNEGRLTLVAGVVQDSVSLSGPGVRGGGIENTGTLTLVNSVVRGNEARYGGLDGIYGGGGISSSGQLSVRASRILDNRSGGNGGGISSSGTATIDESEVSGNSAAIGGGGIDNSGSMTLRRSTVHGNDADGEGGGIVNFRFAGTAAGPWTARIPTRWRPVIPAAWRRPRRWRPGSR